MIEGIEVFKSRNNVTIINQNSYRIYILAMFHKKVALLATLSTILIVIVPKTTPFECRFDVIYNLVQLLV